MTIPSAEVLPDNYAWLLLYFSCYAALNPLDLETEVMNIEFYVGSIQPNFFGKDVARSSAVKQKKKTK